jgi:LssY C-terminus
MCNPFKIGIAVSSLTFAAALILLPGASSAVLNLQIGQAGPETPQAAPETQADSPTIGAHPKSKPRLSQEVQLTGDQLWMDTGLDLQPGEHIVIKASGKLRYADASQDTGPDGIQRGFKDLLRLLPFSGAGRGALIGRVGDPEIAQPFLIGSERDVVAQAGGRLFVGINQTNDETAEGTYKIMIEIHPADPGFHYRPAREVKSIAGIDASVFAKIPRRVADKAGNPGDMINFLIIGSEGEMQKAFTNAGWVKVDADVRDSVLHGLIVSISKEAYLTMPMSQLYLFGRPQDYGWAHAEPIRVVASRNHLRIWKAPFDVKGRPLWVGAATHDIGFERDERNDKLTHKIDPDVDVERKYVEKTLASTGLVFEISYFLPAEPLKEARTATGGAFHSDGRVLVLELDDSRGNPPAGVTAKSN